MDTDERIPFVDGDFDFWPLYDSGNWEPETKNVLERFLSPGSAFLDIGAWIGPVALWACDLGAHVTAYEPDPVAYTQLTHNVKGRGVYCCHAAVTPASGPVAITNRRSFGDSMSQVIHPTEVMTPEEFIDAALIPAAALIESVPPAEAIGDTPWDLVKLDIEGGEVDVLPLLMPLCRDRGIPVYLSWHEPWWSRHIDDAVRRSWFQGFSLIPIRGDGWTSFSELLATPQMGR